MQFSKSESLKIMQLWNDYGVYLEEIFVRMIKDYSEQLSVKDSEWEQARQSIEYLAKKQTLIDLKKLLSQHYE